MQIEVRRRTIAESSGGISSKELCAAVVNLIGRLKLAGTVADLGAGKGDMVRCLTEMNQFSAIVAFDLRDRPPELPPQIQWYADDLNGPIDYPSNSFDLVTSLGLIEYLENPYAFVREVYRILRPQGTAILTTPNNESWRALLSLLLRGSFAGFGRSENVNLTALLPSDFNRMLEFAGFSGVAYDYNNWGRLPKFGISWQAISGGLLRGRRYSDDLLVTCRKQ